MDVLKFAITLGQIAWFVTVGWLLAGLYLVVILILSLTIYESSSTYDSPDNTALENLDSQHSPIERTKRIALFKPRR